MKRVANLLVCCVLLLGSALTQEKKAAPPEKQEAPNAASSAASAEGQSKKAETEKKAEPERPGAVQALAEESNQAAGEEGDQFKQSASVRWLASVTGLRPLAAYWIFTVVNFAIVGFAIFAVLKKTLPGWFRSRSQSIQAGIAEAQRSSEEARKRLADIEARLARMDSEVAAMRSEAESAAATDEQRIRATTEQDKQKIIAAAEQEIVSMSRSAQRELKAYAAELAVQLAEQRIHIDQETDRRLVHDFAGQFGGAADGGKH